MSQTDSLFSQLDFAQEPKKAKSLEQENVDLNQETSSIQTGKKPI